MPIVNMFFCMAAMRPAHTGHGLFTVCSRSVPMHMDNSDWPSICDVISSFAPMQSALLGHTAENHALFPRGTIYFLTFRSKNLLTLPVFCGTIVVGKVEKVYEILGICQAITSQGEIP